MHWRAVAAREKEREREREREGERVRERERVCVLCVGVCVCVCAGAGTRLRTSRLLVASACRSLSLPCSEQFTRQVAETLPRANADSAIGVVAVTAATATQATMTCPTGGEHSAATGVEDALGARVVAMVAMARVSGGAVRVHVEASVPQRSAAWRRLRRGLVTGTRVARVFGLAGRQAQIEAVAELVVERRRGVSDDEGEDEAEDDDDDDGQAATAVSDAVRYGVQTERRHAEVLGQQLGGGVTAVSTAVSFIAAPAAGTGVSPDGFVLLDGAELTLVELKARAGRRLLAPRTVAAVEPEHVLQCLAGMAHSGASSALLSYWQGDGYEDTQRPLGLTVWRVRWDAAMWATVMSHIAVVLGVAERWPGDGNLTEWLSAELPEQRPNLAAPDVSRWGQRWW